MSAASGQAGPRHAEGNPRLPLRKSLIAAGRGTPGRRVALVVLVVALGAAALAAVWAGRSDGPTETSPTETSPAETINQRFPPELATVAAVSLGDRDADLRATHSESPDPGFVERFAAFPILPPAETPHWPDSPAAPDAHAPRGTPVLNDAQIASLKSRLKLTAEQETLWPSVETALRRVVWRRTHDRRNAPVGLDLTSLEQLKTAAGPLMAKLRPEQKREIETVAHVLGLSALIADL